MTKNSGTVLQIDESNYQFDIKLWVEEGRIPAKLAIMLIDLMGSYLNGSMRPEATQELIDLAKKHLMHGIEIERLTGEDEYFHISVFVPHTQSRKKKSKTFLLTPRFKGGTIRRLNEL